MRKDSWKDISEMYFQQFFAEDYINVCNKKKLIGLAFILGHNHFWILYDVIKKGLLAATSRKLITTLLWAVADLALSYIPWNLAKLKAKSDEVQQANGW